MSKELQLQVMGGLCSRWRPIIGAVAYCRKVGRRLTVVWPRKQTNLPNGFEADFHDLWSNDVQVKDVDRPYPKLTSKLRTKESVVRFRSCNISDFRDWMEEPTFRYLDWFEPSEELADFIAVNEDRFVFPLVGVHIRHDMAQPDTAPLDWFLDRMQSIRRQYENVHFFLSSDSPDVSRRVHRTFPGRVIEQPKTYRYDREGVIRSCADVYLMARTDWLIGSNRSSMSQIAVFLRGGEDDRKRNWRYLGGAYEDYWNRPKPEHIAACLKST